MLAIVRQSTIDTDLKSINTSDQLSFIEHSCVLKLWDIGDVLRLHRSGCVGRVEFRRYFDAQWISLIGFFSLSELSIAVRPLQMVAPEPWFKESFGN